MSDDKTDADMKECADDTKANKQSIEEVDRAREHARGNVHSDAEDGEPDVPAMPPMPN